MGVQLPWKYISLVLLVVQNTALVLLMHYSRMVQGPMYSASSAVLSMEVVKFITCCVVVNYERKSLFGFIDIFDLEVIQKPNEVLKLSIPGLIYLVQNRLLYFALSNLDAATYQVLYQLKILTTALFSVTMLNRHLKASQWLSLVLLAIGVTFAQLSTSNIDSIDSSKNSYSGFMAVLVASITSGYAGVYFERHLKGSGGNNIWIKNIQLGVSSVIFATVSCFLVDFSSVMSSGYFYGYSSVVWGVILLQALGGLVVASVVMYADNILKGFASGMSILLSSLLCVVMFDFHVTVLFVIGAGLVNFATWVYNRSPNAPSHASTVAKKLEEEGDVEKASFDGKPN